MKPSEKFNRESRDAEKRASRRAGEDPAILQRENSIFPEGFFRNARVSSRRQSLGRQGPIAGRAHFTHLPPEATAPLFPSMFHVGRSMFDVQRVAAASRRRPCLWRPAASLPSARTRPPRRAHFPISRRRPLSLFPSMFDVGRSMFDVQGALILKCDSRPH